MQREIQQRTRIGWRSGVLFCQNEELGLVDEFRVVFHASDLRPDRSSWRMVFLLPKSKQLASERSIWSVLRNLKPSIQIWFQFHAAVVNKKVDVCTENWSSVRFFEIQLNKNHGTSEVSVISVAKAHWTAWISTAVSGARLKEICSARDQTEFWTDNHLSSVQDHLCLC